MTQRWLRGVVVLVVAVGGGGVSAGQNFDRTALRGLDGVAVIVEPVIDDGGLYGLHRTGLRADAEYLLEAAGIRVLSREVYLDVPAAPYLHIDVRLVAIPDAERYAYSITVELRQDVLSAITPDTVLYDTATWRAAPLVGSLDGEGLRTVRDTVEALVERFVEDFVAANR